MKKYLILSINFIIILFTFLSCNDEDDFEPVKLPVFEGVLVEGEPVTHIRLKYTIFADEDLDDAEPINNADISITWNGNVYQLVSSDGNNGWYNYPENDLQVVAGDTYKIEIKFERHALYAETEVPSRPVNVSISETRIKVKAQIDIFNFDPMAVLSKIEWDNSTNGLYFVDVKNVESKKVEVMEGFGVMGMMGEMPVQPIDNFDITLMQLTYLGKHEATVYHVDKYYAEFSQAGVLDTRSLNEPNSNVSGARGVFASVAKEMVTYKVVRP